MFGQLGHGYPLADAGRVRALEGVCSIAVSDYRSLAVTHSGDVFGWGAFQIGVGHSRRPVIVEGFGGVRVRRVFAGIDTAFAIGEAGELFSWGIGMSGLLGHGDEQDQPSPKRVEAVRGVPVSSVAFGMFHVLALAEDGLVYAWGQIPTVQSLATRMCS
jgi:alpha-tubulin suppressor-like RCC1 family protein